ncbi:MULTISPECIES: restriction endonuclease [unclassified Arthrobacter]|uniref:HNH endonuclease n=1 Tax=unclassified Arthrobacter TaxID=235627 RepID=UPI001E2B4E44|nr:MULTISPECIES: restriction endonuclease [unclassified Arthrobacter]MCC9145815.1 restriction endonuclease [Arthrobacter sp. zg-Y919]MDK1277044.1 restriction endonuclease [Arthrobacter sp. zg.Y919]WIB03573.1 restriction endonuclease [Arthrobacter sp. zg-Y919]
MPSVLLPWNADLPDPWPGGYGPAVSTVAGGGTVRRSVPLSGARPAPGAEVWLVLCGNSGRGPRGLAGHGIVSSDENHGGPGAVTVDFDLLLPLGEELPAVLLQESVPALPALSDGGAAAVPPASVPALRRLWSGFLGSGPDPLSPVPGTLDAQALVLQPANRYEHDAEARRLCLAYHGDSCAACGLVPVQRYGPGAQALLQVHHLVPGPDLPAGYILDPVSDLVPLCPTCHTVAHTRVPVPYTPAEVRALLSAAPDAAAEVDPAGTGVAAVVVGSVVTAEQQQALDDAARLRGLR